MDVFANPSGKLLAFGDTAGGDENQRLMLLDIERKTTRFVADDVHFSERPYPWSPDGTKLAFVACKDPGAYGSIHSTGVWIYDIKTGEKERIHETGFRVGWAPFDGRLYIMTYQTELAVSYDPKTKVFQDSTFRDVYFSPDGKYYYVSSSEPGEVELYAVSTNERLWQDRLNGWEGPSCSAWFGRHFLVILPSDPGPHGALLDCATGTVWDVPDEVIAVVDNGKNLLSRDHKTKTLQKKALADLEILVPRKEPGTPTAASQAAKPPEEKEP